MAKNKLEVEEISGRPGWPQRLVLRLEGRLSRPSANLSIISRILLGTAVTAAFLSIRLALNNLLAAAPYVLMMGAISVSSLTGGLVAGLAALCLTLLAQVYYFYPPYLVLSFDKLDSAAAVGLIVYCLTAFMIIFLVSLLRFARRLASRAISASRQHYARVIDSEKRFRSLIDNSYEAICTINSEGIVQYASPSTQRILGYSPEEFMGTNGFNLFYEDDLPMTTDTLKEVLSAPDKVKQIETRVRRKDGQVVWVAITGANRVEDPEIGGIVVNFRDITDRKRYEEELDRRINQQAAVTRLGQMALTGTNLQKLLDETVEIVAGQLNVEYCKVLELLDEEGNPLLLRSGVGWQPGLVGEARVDSGMQSQAGYTLATSGPVVVEDLKNETRFKGMPLLRNHGVRSGLSVIIPTHEGPYGVLGAHSRSLLKFTADDVAFVQAVANVLGTVIDRKRLENRQLFLSQASQLLSSSLDYENTLKTLVRLAVPGLADWCAIDMLDERDNRRMYRLAAANSDPDKTALAFELEKRFPYDPDSPVGSARVVKTGEPIFMPEIKPAELRSAGYDDQRVQLVEELGLKSGMSLPLKAEGKVVGVLLLIRAESVKQYNQEDLRLAKDLAARASAAIENSRLYRESLMQKEFLSTLHESTLAVLEKKNPEELLRTILERAGRLVGAANGYIYLLNQDGTQLEVKVGTGIFADYTGYTIKRGEGLAGQVWEKETPVTVEDYDQWPHRKTDFKKGLFRAAVGIPLRTSRGFIGVISLAYTEPTLNFGPTEVGIISQFAPLASLAIEGAELYSEAVTSRNQLKAVFENVADGLIVRHRSGEVVFANEAAAKITGFQSAEALTEADRRGELTTALDFRDESGRALEPHELPTRQVLQTGQPAESTIQLFSRQSARHRWLNVKTSPVFNDRGELEFAVTLFQDITALKRTEEQKDEFIQIASHELKTPVTSMKLYAQSLLRAAQRRSAPVEEIQGLKIIARQIDRLIRLVGNILDVTKIEAGGIALNPRSFDLVSLINEAVVRLGQLIDNPLSVKGQSSFWVDADPDRIEQVLVNLITNAAQHSPSGSPIEIMLSATPEGVTVSVIDQGSGIPYEQQPLVFERFFQTEGKRSVGVGLGLYISKQIISRHGGQIGVESVPGQGSRFYFTLPAGLFSRIRTRASKLLRR